MTVPMIAVAKAIKGGYSIEGLETPAYVTATLPTETPDGTPVLLSPTTHDLVQRLENRADQITELWAEAIRDLREKFLNQGEEACESGDKFEFAATLLALSRIAEEGFGTSFKTLFDLRFRMHDAGCRVYKALERDTMAQDGWVQGPRSGPVTQMLRDLITGFTGQIPTDSQIKEAMDGSDCGNPNCPIHGKLNGLDALNNIPASPRPTNAAEVQAEKDWRAEGGSDNMTGAGFQSGDTLLNAIDREVTREEANRTTRGESGDTLVIEDPLNTPNMGDGESRGHQRNPNSNIRDRVS